MYSHSAKIMFKSEETGHWKTATCGINRNEDGTFTSGERIGKVTSFDKYGRSESGAEIIFSTIKNNT